MIRHYESQELIPERAGHWATIGFYTARDIPQAAHCPSRSAGWAFPSMMVGTLLGLWQNERRAARK
jgi:hypothetical protein